MSKSNTTHLLFTASFKHLFSPFIAFSLIFNPFIFASDITVDKTSNAPSIELSPNGKIPVINIVKPNEQGLSHNKFKDYNVNKDGVILNNSNELTNTELAGYIMNNPNFGKGNSAKVILNEVTGTKKSNLLGYTEVAGDKADVIIANPNGIYVNGGGFINVHAATLTTGELKFKDGLLNGFDVNRGDITIDGLGFNANNIDRVNFYSKTLLLNSKLYANRLNIILGDNNISNDGSFISKETSNFGLSLDSSSLGGIYANTIYLTSSDKGVGVNLPPEVLLSDTLTLSANGDILLNNIVSGDKISLTSSSDVSLNSDKTLLAESIDIKADNLLNNGEINALNGHGISNIDIANSIINNALIAGYDLNVYANDLTNSADSALYAKNILDISSNDFTNEETGYVRSDNSLYFNVKNSLRNGGDIYSYKNLFIGSKDQKTKSVISFNGATIESHGDISIFANKLDNVADAPKYMAVTEVIGATTVVHANITKMQYNTIPFTMVTVPDAYNYNKTRIIRYEDKLVQANNPSKILSDGSINMDVDSLKNYYSIIAANKDVTINANSVQNVGKVALNGTLVEIEIWKGGSSCNGRITCKKIAVHDRTTHEDNRSRIPAINYGIQAGGSINGTIVTLENIAYVSENPEKEAEMRADLITLEKLNQNSASLNNTMEFFSTLKDNIKNHDATEDEVNTFDIEPFLAFDDETLYADYQNNILMIIDNYMELLSDNLNAINDLENTLSYLENLNGLEDKTAEINTVKNSINNLKINVTEATDKLNYLQDVYTVFSQEVGNDAKLIDIVTEDSINNAVADVLYVNNGIKELMESGLDTLSTGFFDTVNTLSSELQFNTDTLSDKIDADTRQYGSVTDKIITNQNEGLYRIGASNSIDNTDIPTFNEVTIDGVVIPAGKYGEFIASKSQEYLIESNPLYADFNAFIGSGYLQSRLNFDQELTFRRLGDGMYETKLIRDAIMAQTGNRYLDGYYSDTDQFQALMDNALGSYEDLGLTYGIALTYEQISNLRDNIVWMVEKEIEGQKVLVPVLYLASNNINDYGPKIMAGEDITLNIAGEFTNTGYVKADNDLDIKADALINTQGVISSSNNMNIHTDSSLLNQSGVFISGNDMNIISEGTITSTSLVGIIDRSSERGTQMDTIMGLSGAFISGGSANILANDNILLLNTDLIANNNVNIISNKDVTVGKIAEKNEWDIFFSGGRDRGLEIINHGSNIQGSNINIAGTNILIDTSNLNADGLIYLNARKNIDILSSNDIDYSDVETTLRGIASKTTTREMSYHEDTVSSTLSASNIFMGSGANVTLEAAKLKANNNIYIDAKENINAVAKLKKDADIYMKSKSSWGGLKKSLDLKESEAFTLSSSDIETIANNIVFKSGEDINIIASNINSASDLQLEAFDNILIAAGIEASHINELHKSSSFNVANLVNSFATAGLITESIYQSDMVKDKTYDNTAKSSNLNSGNNIIIKSGQASVVGSNLEAENNIVVKTDFGDINIITAEELKETLHEEKHIDVSLANSVDIIKGIIDNEKKGEDKDSKIKLTAASASFDEDSLISSATNHKSSSLKAKNGNIILDSFGDVVIEGSDLEATNGVVAMASQIGEIIIKEAMDTEEDKEKSKHAKADISVTIQNEYAEIGSAVKAAIESAEQLKKVKNEYSAYKKEVKNLEGTLSELKEKYKNKEAGITREDIEDLESIIDNIKDEEKYYAAALAAASADLASKTVAIAAQTASAAASSGTWGFSVGLALDLQGSETKTNTKQTSSISSNINAKDIILATSILDEFGTTTISGSNLQASDSINIQTRNLNILSSADTLIQNQNTKDLTASVSMTMYGGGAGAGISAGYGESHSDSDYTYNTNSNLISNNINIYVANDANIKGSTIRADDTVNMYVGNNLNFESVRDSYSSNSKGFNVGVGISDGTTNANINTNQGNYQEKQVILSSITGNTVNLNVEGNTNLKGSLIAAGNFDESGNFVDNS
ncbi:MAG: hemagglutinin repeat-containing protein, partial [Campylobacteraceae bacterium]|nr:hemagglutinin repeat-containing protein [Campylobacteraceae bacterium]